MAIFHDPVSLLQCFGYSVALSGLVYYKLGGQSMQGAVTQAKLTINGIRAEHPRRTRAGLLMGTLGLVAVGLLLWWPDAISTGTGAGAGAGAV